MLDLTQNRVGNAYLESWLETAKEFTPLTSNQPALSMAFQRWFKFKEAFAPSFVVDTIRRLPYQPSSCLDPFGGSGTTALTCQFLGIRPTTIEVNPFMADVIEAKLTKYNAIELRYEFRILQRRAYKAYSKSKKRKFFVNAPETFVEPGKDDRWIFNLDVAKAISSLKSEIDNVSDVSFKRFFRVMLGCRLVELSNMLVNGKGRRYRSQWQKRSVTGEEVFLAFSETCMHALTDIESYSKNRTFAYTLLRGDARNMVKKSAPVDFILTSPPYPNSFDYTDIYNIELWILGYLNSSDDNHELREQTLRSHVQIAHKGEASMSLSKTLQKTYRALAKKRKNLWNTRIPEMVCHYFEDMRHVLLGSHEVLADGGHMVLAVGDSRYDGVLIDVPKILTEIVEEIGFKLVRIEPVRSMRSSAQQGGRHVLTESLVWLES